MTLNTSIVIADPISLDDLWEFARWSIGTPEETPFEDNQPNYRPDGRRHRLNPGGMGLPGWLWLHYHPDGPLLTKEAHEASLVEFYGSLSAAKADGEHPYEHPWPVLYRVALDTAYGARAENGAGCSDLHAAWVHMVGTWLEMRGVRWRWENEFTGEWFDTFSPESMAGLAAFGNAPYGAEGMAQDLLAYRVPAPKAAEAYRALFGSDAGCDEILRWEEERRAAPRPKGAIV